MTHLKDYENDATVPSPFFSSWPMGVKQCGTALVPSSRGAFAVLPGDLTHSADKVSR